MYLSEFQLITTAIRVCLFDIDKWSFLNLRRKFTKLVVKMYTAWSVSLATLLAFQLYHLLQQFILSLWVWLIYGVMLSISCFHTPQLTYNKGNKCMDSTIYYEAFPQHLWDILTWWLWWLPQYRTISNNKNF